MKPQQKEKPRHNETSEKHIIALLENECDGIMLCDTSGKITWCSKAMKKISGYAAQELLTKQGIDLIHPEDQHEARRVFSTLLRKPKKSVNLFQRIRHKKGHYIWCESILKNLSNDFHITGIAFNFRVVDGQKIIELQTREVPPMLATITGNLREGVFMASFGKPIIYANESCLRITGYNSMHEMKKIKPAQLYIHEADRKRIMRELERTGSVKNIEVEFYRKNKERFWALISMNNLTFQGDPNCFVCTIQDISDRLRTEKELRQNQQLLSSISGNISEGIFRSSISHGLVYVNDAFVKLFGYSSKEEIMKTDPNKLYFSKNDRSVLMNLLKKEGRYSNREIRHRKKNGEGFWGLTSSVLTYGEDGKLYIDGVVRDITKQKQAEQEILDSRNFLDNIINTVAAPIFVKDSHHRWIKFNNQFCQLVGVKAEDMLGKNDKDFLKDEELKIFWRIDSQVLKTGKTILNEEKITSVNGKTHDVITVKSRYVNESGEKFVIGFVTDITKIKKVEAEIHQLNANLRGILESTSESIYALDKNFNYTAFNRNHQRMAKLLYNVDISIGTNKLKCIRGTPDEKWLSEELTYALQGNHLVTVRHVNYPRYKDRFIQITYNPIHDTQARGVAVFVSDITLRKQTEAKLNAVNEELTLQNRRLAAREADLKAALSELSDRNFELDQLMYKTSHDLRAPLSSILGLVNLANVDKDAANQDEYLNKIEGRIKKLDEFIKSMLNYARVNRSDISFSRIKLVEVAENCIHELQYLENFSAVRTSIKITGENVPFRCDPLRVSIIFGNVISNAYKYYNPERKSYLKISISVTKAWAQIEFKDNGIGIKKEYMDKIFNMFYRATERSQGSGLGMYIVKQAVEKLGGTIQVKSNYGTGTTIKIKLPNN